MHGDPAAEVPDLGYPPGYRDPPYDGTPDGFAAVVLPARRAALLTSLNDAMAPHLPHGMRFADSTEADPAYRHGGPDAGWYRPGPDGWQRITDAEAANERHEDMAHFMTDPNGRHGPVPGPGHTQ